MYVVTPFMSTLQFNKMSPEGDNDAGLCFLILSAIPDSGVNRSLAYVTNFRRHPDRPRLYPYRI